MPRTILHIDLDAFFCSVEERLNPGLHDRPFVVAGAAGKRGVVASASYAARPFGVRSAMPTAQALRLCPTLIVVTPRHGRYGEESDVVMRMLRDAAPVVEQTSIDEAFLDVSDDPRPGREVAAALQAAIGSERGLPSSWGVATNKMVAKIATEVGKPRGLVVVPPGEEAAFLAPLPVGMLWGVGPKTTPLLIREGVRTIGELAALSADRLTTLFGDRGPELASQALGLDDRPVVEEREPQSMSSETTFARDVASGAELHRVLLGLSEEVGGRLRQAGLAGSTVRIKLRWPNFTTITRQQRLRQPTDQDGEIYRSARALFDQAWRTGRPVRLLGVAVSALRAPFRQLNLFDRSWEEDERLLQAIDAIRSRYGQDAVRRASLLREGRSLPDRTKGERS
jgi:DNA polymerase-4